MAYAHRRDGQATEHNARTTGSAAADPGKRTLVETALGGVTAAPVQRKATDGTAPVQRQADGNAAAAGNVATNAGTAANAGDAQAAQAADTRVLSGAAWCAQYPTGTTIAALTDDTFRSNVQAFHDVMVAAATAANGLSISISATYRPPERAHLMHYAFRVHNGTTTPAAANTASAAAGININWDHGNLATSKAKAGEMVTTYDIAYAPALHSRHTEGKAIDWTITWSGSLMIAKKNETTKLDCTGNGTTSDNLHAVGASYGVHKLASDPPHWSTDGH
jgi:hypothetical protein